MTNHNRWRNLSGCAELLNYNSEIEQLHLLRTKQSQTSAFTVSHTNYFFTCTSHSIYRKRPLYHHHMIRSEAQHLSQNNIPKQLFALLCPQGGRLSLAMMGGGVTSFSLCHVLSCQALSEQPVLQIHWQEWGKKTKQALSPILVPLSSNLWLVFRRKKAQIGMFISIQVSR